MFLVLAVKKEIEANVYGRTVSIPFSSAGFLGVCPVFSTKEEAEKWADDKAEVVEITYQ